MSQGNQTVRRSVWLATDVPFWKESNGSHQRILQLAQALHSADFELSLWFVGETIPKVGEALVHDGPWKQVLGPALPPSGLLRRVAWHWEGARALARRSSSRSVNSLPGLSAFEASRDITDFYDESIARRWVSDLQVHKPDAVIVEYVSLSYLADAARRSTASTPLLLLDSHDVMWQRAARFRDEGLRNWLEISPQEEAEALSSFDVIMAIQEEEAAEFRRLAPDITTVVCGHVIPSQLSAKRRCYSSSETGVSGTREGNSRPLVVGLISGAGSAAEHGVSRFIEHCWDSVCQAVTSDIELHIAGSICDSLTIGRPIPPGVKMRGRVDNLSDWYASLDLAINPIDVGSGLKIKSIEALSFGCPLVTTAVGIEGIRSAIGTGALVADSIDEMVEPIVQLALDRGRRAAMSEAAIRYIRSFHTGEQVYGDLIRALSRIPVVS